MYFIKDGFRIVLYLIVIGNKGSNMFEMGYYL